jgi:hypothetical protein
MVYHRIPVERWKSKNGADQEKSQMHKPDIEKLRDNSGYQEEIPK